MRVVGQVRNIAAAHADRPAVCEGERSVGFGELVARASIVCDDLRSQGIGPEDVVAVVMPRSTSSIVALLGIWMAGAAYLPIDPRWPERRREHVLRSAAAVVALEVGPDGELHGRPIEASGAAQRRPVDGSGGSQQPEISGRNLAYVLSTSGSTGVPNAVGVEIDALNNYDRYLRGLVADLPVDDAHPSVLLSTSLSFDASLRPVLLLAAGWTLVIAPDLVDGSWQEQIDCIEANRVQVLSGSPTWFSGLLGAGFSPRKAGVRLVFAGGEPVPNSLVARLKEDGCTVVVQYGPTETTVAATGAVLTDADYASPPIGDPIPGVRVSLRPVVEAPEGLRGGLASLDVGGVGVARGYLGNPRLTAERFVPDPTGPPGSRMFRTGDLVRADTSDALGFVGREDDQIKLGGQRVELAEITTTIDRHPSVAHSAVLVVERGAHRRLVACYLTRRGVEEPLDPDLRGWVASELPTFMVPSRFEHVEAFPMTAHGKIDFAALSAMVNVREDSGAEPDGGSDEVERRLVAFVSEAVGGPCRLDDDFFALGGGSLDALRFLARVREEFGVRVRLREFYRDATVRSLRERIGAST